MATVKERVAYLRGLMQGSGIGQNPNEQQVWNELFGNYGTDRRSNGTA